jgi:hypothetical protein
VSVLNAVLKSSAASIILTTNAVGSLTNDGLITDSAGSLQLQTSTTTVTRSFNGTNAFNATLGSGSFAGSVKTGLAWDSGAATRSLVANNGTVVSNAGAAAFATTIHLDGAGTAALSSYAQLIPRLTVFPVRIPDSSLKAATQ